MYATLVSAMHAAGLPWHWEVWFRSLFDFREDCIASSRELAFADMVTCVSGAYACWYAVSGL